ISAQYSQRSRAGLHTVGPPARWATGPAKAGNPVTFVSASGSGTGIGIYRHGAHRINTFEVFEIKRWVQRGLARSMKNELDRILTQDRSLAGFIKVPHRLFCSVCPPGFKRMSVNDAPAGLPGNQQPCLRSGEYKGVGRSV